MLATYYNNGKDEHGSYLEAVIENEFGEETSKSRTYCPSKKILHNGRVYYLQYDDNMNLLYNVCNYLNFYIQGSSEKTKAFKARIIRQFICFMTLAGFDYNEPIDKYVAEKICVFFTGDDFRTNDRTIRSSQSINNYIAVIRDYATYIYIAKYGLKDKTNRDIKKIINGIITFSKKLSTSKRNNPHANDNIRPFISPKEFLVLRELAINKKDTQSLILFHLMYFYGLRIGECLGMTEEDLEIRQKNFNPSPTLILCNRLSDKDYQYVKGVSHPTSQADYNKKDYPSDETRLSIAFYTELTKYIEAVRKDCEEKGRYDAAKADSIFRSRDKQGNHYIFRNVHGRPLTQQAWNLRLKEYFIMAGIPLDTGTRRDSLNHRFRHGCALYYLRFAGEGYTMNLEQVSALLRHKHLSTTEIYLKMTLDDEFELKQEFQDFLLKNITALI